MKRAGRKDPYTEIGIRRLRCVRCGSAASSQWNACADGVHRPICDECDVLLNLLALQFMRDPDVVQKMAAYVKTKPE